MKIYVIVKETDIVGGDGFKTGAFDTTLVEAYQQEAHAINECEKLNNSNSDFKIVYCYTEMELNQNETV